MLKPRILIPSIFMMAFFDWLFEPETVRWEVTTSALGVIVVAIGSHLLWKAYRLYADRRSLEGRFSTKPIDEAATMKPFSQWPKSMLVQEGAGRIVVGVMSRAEDLTLTQINVRAVERTWFGDWQNPTEPLPLDLKTPECRQLEYERRSWSMQGLFNPWGDQKGGWDLNLRVIDFCLEKGTVIWVSLPIEAKRQWKGAISIRFNVRNGPRLWCRLPIEVVGDNRSLNG